MRVTLYLVLSGVLLLAVQATFTNPVVLYTDVPSGPTSGGENNLGCYLSIFGKNFGDSLSSVKVFIGQIEVANYRFLARSKVYDKTGIQHIAVQVGSLGGASQGVALPVKVVVNGIASNTDHTFTPNPGNIFFASLTGDDATGTANNIAKPYRHLQFESDMTAAIHGQLHAGDHVIIRGGDWSDAVGFETAWLRFRYPQQQGSLPTGQQHTGWIHFTAYPGAINGNGLEDVHYSTPASAKGGFQGANSAYAGTTGDFISISNMRFDMNANAQTDAAPANLQYSTGAWRVVNNEIGPWPSVLAARSGGISGGGDGLTVLGNHVHDISRPTDALENHGIYVDSYAQNVNLGYNWFYNVSGGNLIQLYDSLGVAGSADWAGFNNIQIHHNWLEKCAKYPINLADGTVSAKVWNNIVIGSNMAGIRFNSAYLDNIDIVVAFNTFYDNARVSVMGLVLNTGGVVTGTIKIANNIIAAGPNTVSSADFYVNDGADNDTYISFTNNLYYDHGLGFTQVARDTRGQYKDPLFNGPTTNDLSLQVNSPAVNKGDASLNAAITVSEDFTSIVLRDSKPDLGALEYSNVTVLMPPTSSTPVSTDSPSPINTPSANPPPSNGSPAGQTGSPVPLTQHTPAKLSGAVTFTVSMVLLLPVFLF